MLTVTLELDPGRPDVWVSLADANGGALAGGTVADAKALLGALPSAVRDAALDELARQTAAALAAREAALTQANATAKVAKDAKDAAAAAVVVWAK